jgi:hypothetical protein
LVTIDENRDEIDTRLSCSSDVPERPAMVFYRNVSHVVTTNTYRVVIEPNTLYWRFNDLQSPTPNLYAAIMIQPIPGTTNLPIHMPHVSLVYNVNVPPSEVSTMHSRLLRLQNDRVPLGEILDVKLQKRSLGAWKLDERSLFYHFCSSMQREVCFIIGIDLPTHVLHVSWNNL